MPAVRAPFMLHSNLYLSLGFPGYWDTETVSVTSPIWTVDLSQLYWDAFPCSVRSCRTVIETPTPVLGRAPIRYTRCFVLEFATLARWFTRCVKALPLIVLHPRVLDRAVL